MTGGKEMDERASILIVDDDDGIRRSLTLILGRKGYEIEAASTGQEAIQKAQGRTFNAALLDIKLPDMGGVELLERLREIRPDMVAIMVTGHASLETAVQALNQGASAYITKPLNMDQVLSTMNECLEKQHLAMENRRLLKVAQQELTQRKRVEEELRETNAFLRNILDSSSSVSIISTDLEHNILYWNSGAEEMFGYKAEEVVGCCKIDVLYPDDEETREKVEEIRSSVFDNKRMRCEIRELTRDGRELWIDLNATPRLDENGQVIGILGIGMDVTDRKQAVVDLLRQSAILDAINRVLLETFTCETDQEVANACLAVAEELTGSKFGFIGELNQEGLFDIIAISDPGWDACKMPGSDAVRLTTNMSIRGIDRSTIKEGEFRMVNDPASHPDRVGVPDGHPPITCFLGIPLKYAGKTLGMIGLANKESGYDLADQQAVEDLSVAFAEALMLKRAQTALQESEEKYRVLVENAGEAILVAQDGKSRFVNPKAVELTGYSEDELIPENFALFIHPDDQEMVTKRHIARLSGEQLPGTYAFRISSKNGDLKWVEVNVALITWEERPATLNFLTDITERKHAETALVEERASLAKRVEERTGELQLVNAELARAARLKDEFLASMSHELRTPLSAILGMSEVLQKGIHGTLNEKQSQSLNRIEESGRHLLDLINDILDVSKVEAGKLELELGMVHVESVCQASLQFIKTDAVKKRLSISTSFDSEVPAIWADERRLKQVLVNLLSNAVKFTPEDGAIGLEVAGDLEQEVLRFTVWDTGIGIPEEKIERLFQPFTQLDSSLSRQYEGTGLGLALVSRLVGLHGGSTSVESEMGKGSRFTISLPWEKAILAGGSENDGPLILIADDSEVSISVVSDYLLVSGYSVATARNGAEVIQRSREEAPDLILMDIQMPVMDGLETTRRIRADTDLAGIPIIALTALAMPGDRERCQEAGADDYITKPMSLAVLVKAIAAQLNRN